VTGVIYQSRLQTEQTESDVDVGLRNPNVGQNPPVETSPGQNPPPQFEYTCQSNKKKHS